MFLQNFILIVDEGFNLKALMIRGQPIKDFLHGDFFFCVSRQVLFDLRDQRF